MIYQRQTCQEHAKRGTQTDVKKRRLWRSLFEAVEGFSGPFRLKWQIRGNIMPWQPMAIHGNPSRYGGRGVQYLSTSRSSSRNLNLTPNLRHQDKLRLPPSLWTYHDLSGFTWSKWIKQMNQHGLDGCVMLQISLIKASSANDSTGSIPNLVHPWSVWLSNLSIIINQITNWKSTRKSIPISQSPNLPISQRTATWSRSDAVRARSHSA